MIKLGLKGGRHEVLEGGVEFVDGSHPGSERFFSGFLRFSPLLNLLFQFNHEWFTKNHFVDVLLLNFYLFIYSFSADSKGED